VPGESTGAGRVEEGQSMWKETSNQVGARKFGTDGKRSSLGGRLKSLNTLGFRTRMDELHRQEGGNSREQPMVRKLLKKREESPF